MTEQNGKIDFTKKDGTCLFCKAAVTAKLHLRISVNGSQNFQWMCPACNRLAPFGGDIFIKKELVTQYITPEQIDKLPVVMPDASSRCVRCGKRDSELHHWAPRAFFGDACNNWPKDYLCRECHEEWHHKVTPGLLK